MTEIIETPKRACTTCVLCLRDDYGYSNYTCEGTLLSCLAGLNPNLEDKEAPYSDTDMTPALAEALDVARTCPRYRFGAPATLDVEREGLPYDKPVTAEMVKAAGYTDDDEAAQLLAARQSGI
jgi:hypothetical protein